MSHTVANVLLTFALLLGMLVLLELGRRRGLARHGDSIAGTGAIEAAIIGLLGLLIGFTFSGAASRFDDRRHLIANEANAIGTAYLRIDLLPPDAQPPVRERFGRYLDARLETHRQGGNLEAALAAWRRAAELQREIWSLAVAASRRPEAPQPAATMLVVPALNEMFDIATTRKAAVLVHPPSVIVWMLFGLSLVSAFLAGYAFSVSKKRPLAHMLVLALAVSGTFYVIRDLEYPRLGLIRVDASDQPLIDLRRNLP
jgi:hypothetical protein